MGRHLHVLGAAAALVMGNGCADPTTDVVGDDLATARTSAFTVLASEPVALAAAPRTAYVWIPAGTLDSGTTVRLRNSANGVIRLATIDSWGGLDPVPLPAALGDEIEVTALGSPPGTTVAYAKVPERRRPKVVRTDPPRGKTDVPVNASIVIVVSEPLDSSTVNGETIRLLKAGDPVDGLVQVRRSEPERAEFLPSVPLDLDAEYLLVVTNGITDLNGEPLEQGVTVVFRTAPDPPPIPPLVRFVRVTAGGDHTCGLGADSLAWCWGDGAHGQLGTMSLGAPTVPGPVTGGHHFESLAAGSQTTCGRAAVALCWGWVPHPRGATNFEAPADVFGSAAVTPLVGFGRICRPAVGGVRCTGKWTEGWTTLFMYGSLDSMEPYVGTPPFVSYSAGGSHDCLLTVEGEAFCFGWSMNMQLGRLPDPARDSVADPNDPLLRTLVLQPIRVKDVPLFAAIAAGGLHTCALSATGEPWCWGRGNGPAPVAARLAFTSITVGEEHACALTAEGDAYCWSWMNGWGVLGDGTYGWSRSPVAVAGGYRYVQLSAGAYHTCGIATTGYTYCWGRNAYGQLGDGTRENRYVPTLVANQP